MKEGATGAKEGYDDLVNSPLGEAAALTLSFLPVGRAAGMTKSALSWLGKLLKFSKTDQPNPPSPVGKPHVEKQPEGAPPISAYPHDPYQEAMNGGKHSGWAKPYLDKPSNQLEKGIRSFEKNIELHKDKIRNPEKHCSDWNEKSIEKKKYLINKHWPNEIKNFNQQKFILEGILKSRK